MAELRLPDAEDGANPFGPNTPFRRSGVPDREDVSIAVLHEESR